MALTLPDHWLWDHWVADDGEQYHLFFLRASRALHDPDRRHWRAALGHAVSDDARDWRLLPDALVHSDGPAFDDQAIWTGCTVMRPDGGMRVFYTGISRAERGMVQRIGWADSADGITFERRCAEPLEADGRWYEKWNPGYAFDEPWRDPFVFQHEGRWHMLITARARGVDRLHAGVIGHAVSDDLDHWEVLPPLTDPSRFGQLEVSQSRQVEGQHLLVFSCGDDMQAEPGPGGVWIAEGAGPLGPWDVDAARYLRPEHLYAGQLFRLRDGQWVLTGFNNVVDGEFVGSAPDPLAWTQVERVARMRP
ncbi:MULTISPECIES: glycosyl hydrolase family 32 [unclassified Actinomyces]|uniref:glycosyl hydrolase family 32 n=1 Tax=unclassified Actinomyces TaxID=2609248 RepID=UPI000D596E16|nr:MULTISPECIES: glycosyl hydrolase family 32 [unclassified Actinomyces]RAX22777.1 glycosyl hydrolase family 32 [Actinomyces sp. Z5]RAX23435.1 glycosyl hydrolase family 32 [Actinomyces sp. Z3]